MKKIRIPFSLDEYNKGGYKVYDNKGEVSIIKTDVKINNDICKKYPIVGISICDEVPYANFYTEDGTCLVGEEYNKLVLVKQEFEDGDILADDSVIKHICIYESYYDSSSFNYHSMVSLEKNGDIHSLYLKDFCDSDSFRLATEEEKQKLFVALAKEGKRWNAETKQVEDITPKCALRPFDKVIVRIVDSSIWCCDIFSHFNTIRRTFVCTGEINYDECVPFNDETKYLLGTTEDAPEKYKTW